MSKKYLFLVLVLAILAGYIYYLKYELAKIESELQTYSISNTSLQKELGKEVLFSLGLTGDLQTCLDSKSEFAEKINKVNLELKNTKAELIKKDKVVDNETLKIIIDTLNSPLPSYK